MKKILILGIGFAQVDAILCCKKMGYYVYTCSNTENGPGKIYCDEFKKIDITDMDSILEYATEISIDFIYSIGSDVAMPTVSYVSERLNLQSFISYDVARVCNSKNEIRQLMGDENVFNVKYQTLEKVTDNLEIDFPFIMKPVDSQGQRGVVLVNNHQELIDNFNSSINYSKQKKVIIEEYINGRELSVNAYLINGKIVCSLMSDRVSWSQFDGGIIRSHVVPSTINDESIKKEINDLVKSTIVKIGLINGPVYFQIKLKGNSPKLIEVAPRLDGCHLWRVLKYFTSVNLLELTFKHLTENKIDNKAFQIEENEGRFKLEFICEKPLSKVNEEKYHIGDSLYLEKYYTPGEVVKKVNGLYEKIGYYITT